MLDAVIVGGGPAGLMAAETARAAGFSVHVLERMGSAGRKFLVAGKGGLNLTHSEPKSLFVQRYSAGGAQVSDWLEHFDGDALRTWALGLGVETMIGSSGRVFPNDLKAAPLMRAWLRRLKASGVSFSYGARCTAVAPIANGFSLRIESAAGVESIATRSVCFATGGGSWAKLGSDGSWQSMLQAHGVKVAPLMPSNCGFQADWSAQLVKFAGQPIKPVGAALPGCTMQKGELMLTEYGLEGSLIYALSSQVRSQLQAEPNTKLLLDLVPDSRLESVTQSLLSCRAALSLTEKLKRSCTLSAVKLALYYEATTPMQRSALALDLPAAAKRLKALPVQLLAARPIDEAISTAGGVALAGLSDSLMLSALPGAFCAGEMLDWDAPTGGYLLTACFASGRRAGQGMIDWLNREKLSY